MFDDGRGGEVGDTLDLLAGHHFDHSVFLALAGTVLGVFGSRSLLLGNSELEVRLILGGQSDTALEHGAVMGIEEVAEGGVCVLDSGENHCVFDTVDTRTLLLYFVRRYGTLGSNDDK
jgi:hypothetical protein